MVCLAARIYGFPVPITSVGVEVCFYQFCSEEAVVTSEVKNSAISKVLTKVFNTLLMIPKIRRVSDIVFVVLFGSLVVSLIVCIRGGIEPHMVAVFTII